MESTNNPGSSDGKSLKPDPRNPNHGSFREATHLLHDSARTLRLFLPENRKYRLTDLYDAPLEGLTIFLYRSSTNHTSLVSSGLTELKYAFFSRTGRNTEKLRPSNLFQLTIFKQGLLQGSTILLQYSSISRTKLESSLLGELKCAISAAYDVTLKKKSIRKCEK